MKLFLLGLFLYFLVFFGNLARIQIASGHIVTILAVLVVVISISAVVLGKEEYTLPFI